MPDNRDHGKPNKGATPPSGSPVAVARVGSVPRENWDGDKSDVYAQTPEGTLALIRIRSKASAEAALRAANSSESTVQRVSALEGRMGSLEAINVIQNENIDELAKQTNGLGGEVAALGGKVDTLIKVVQPPDPEAIGRMIKTALAASSLEDVREERRHRRELSKTALAGIFTIAVAVIGSSFLIGKCVSSPQTAPIKEH